MPHWDTLELVSGITVSSSRVSLKNAFSSFGEVSLVWLPPCEKRGVDRGYVKFARAEAAQKAYDALSSGQVLVDGNVVKAEWKKSTEKAKDTRDFDAKGSNLVSARDLFMADRNRNSNQQVRRSRSNRRRRSRSKKKRRRSSSSSSSSSSRSRRRNRGRSRGRRPITKPAPRNEAPRVFIDDGPRLPQRAPADPPVGLKPPQGDPPFGTKPPPIKNNEPQSADSYLKRLLAGEELTVPTSRPAKIEISSLTPEIPQKPQTPEIALTPVSVRETSVQPTEQLPIGDSPPTIPAATWEPPQPAPLVDAAATPSFAFPSIPTHGLLSKLPGFNSIQTTTPATGFDADELRRRIALIPADQRPRSPEPAPPPEPPAPPPEPPVKTGLKAISEEDVLELIRLLRKERREPERRKRR